jgi:GT2 family glycosyltransferase
MNTIHNSDFDPLTSPALEPVFWTPERLGRLSAWWGHVPFAFWLVAKTEPRLLVELGTHHGVSYAAFCEAVLRLRLPTRCYAVDTWTGDLHAGFYDAEVYTELKEFHDNRYASFSQLVRKTFDEACDDFAHGSIDLLHIDGLHTFEAVRHDFETWRPKLSSRALVLFHDTNERGRDFGVWRFLGELQREAPAFEFLHEHGLGLVAVGADVPEAVKRLFELKDETEVAAVRQRFSQIGARWMAEQERATLRAHTRSLEVHARALEDALAQKGNQITDIQAAERETAVKLVAERDSFASQLEAARNEFAQQLDGNRAEFAILLAERDARLAENAAFMAERDVRLAEKDALIADKNRLIAERERQVNRTEAALVDRERELASAKVEVAQKEAALAEQSNLHARMRFEQEKARAAAASEATARFSRLTEDRDFLARHLSRTFHRPWRPFKHHINYHLLRSFSALTAPFSARMAARFARSAQKRNPSRFDACVAPGFRVPVTASTSSRGAPDSPAPANPESPQDAKEQAPALFDGNYYLERYSNVAEAGVEPYWHFVHYGWHQGHNPNEFFDVSWYLEKNPDVREASIDPLKHYIEYGWKEGRDPGPEFSAKNYLDRYRDVRGAGSEPLEHYLRYGKLEGRLIGESYSDWIAKYDTLDNKLRTLMLERVMQLALQPRLSIVMPVYNTDLRWLREAIESVRAQLYPHWELCISDNASTLPGVKELLREYADKDERIRVFFRDTNGHICANSNSALSIATGDFIVLMDSDDILPEDALYWAAEEINAHPDVDLIYSDEDKVDIDGSRYEPYFKPDWNPALMLSQNTFSHLGVYRHSLVKKVGGFRLSFEGSQDHDLVLRCADETEASKIRHIAHVLYHWRALPESTASSFEAKPYAWNAGARAIEEHLARNGVKGKVTRALKSFYQISYDPPSECPTVSIIIPTTCKLELLRPCLSELLSKTTYSKIEVLLAVNEIDLQNEEKATCLKEFAEDPRVRVLVYKDCDFNYSWVNNWAAKQASGSILCFMNDDVKIITTDWLEKLVARLQLNRVGAVGVMLYFPNETIQHAGVILGICGVSAHPFRGLARGAAGYVGRAGLEQDLSCVTAACVAVRREVFEDLNGFDERFAIAFNDVDFCIRLRQKGWRIIWTPEVEHYHLESQSVGRHDSDERAPVLQHEIRMMRDRWGAILASDPFYNPNLSLQDDKMVLAFPPRAAKRELLQVDHESESTQGKTRERCVRYRVDRFSPVASDDDVLIYLAYCADGILTAFQNRSIGLYASQGYRVILVVNSGEYNRIVDPGETPAFIQIVRENIGFDFGAWVDAVRLVGGLDRVRSVTFTNDSLIGPVTTAEALCLHKKVDDIDADVVFLTESYEIQKHYQSYFFILKRSALAGGGLRLIKGIPYAKDKRSLILDFEIPLSSNFEAAGLSTSAAFPCPQADMERTNPTIRYWRELVASGFPFVKVVLITDGHVGYDNPALGEIVGASWLELLKDHVKRRVPFALASTRDANAPPAASILTPVRARQMGHDP